MFLFIWASFCIGCCQLYAQNMDLKKKAECGDKVAQCRYAESLAGGFSPTQQELEEAVFWYKKSAGQGYSPAQRQLGDAYFYGYGVKKDVQLAIEWYKLAAAQNNPVALYNLGVCYTSGIGVPQSSEVAAVLYCKSAESGYDVAQNALGKCFLEGNGISQNYMKAVGWFQKAIAQGNVYAKYNLGRCYSLGLGVIKNPSKAVELYQECAENGHTGAQYQLGLSYLGGAGVKKDSLLAARWLLASAGGGGILIHNTFGYDAEKANKESREKLFHLATESSLGLQSYLYVLIGCLLEAEANYEEAEKYYRQAIGLGNFLGAAKLGLMYFYINANDELQMNYQNDHTEGLQLECWKYEDYEMDGLRRFLKNKQWKANDNTAYWLEKVIENNYGLFPFGAMSYTVYDHVLFCYYDGIGSSKDIVKAIDFSYRFIKDAIDDLNSPIENAEFVLDQELENGPYAQYAFEAYKELYRLATTNDSKYSSRLLRLAAAGLGKAYYKGFGIQLNYEKAFEYLTISANLGNSESMRLLAACYRYGRGTAVDSVKENEWLEKATKRRADKKAKQILERRKKNIIEDAF